MNIKTITATLLGLTLSTAAFSGTPIQGYVFEDTDGDGIKDRKEKGIPGVGISDGESIVLTDNSGFYKLDARDHSVIFAIKPKGYTFEKDEKVRQKFYYINKPDGSPKLKNPGSSPTGPMPENLNFPVVIFDDPEDFKFFAFGDPQPYSEKELGFFKKKIIEEAKQTKGISFGISLGDICGERPDLYPMYTDAMKELNMPWYNVIGNHDRNYDCKKEKYANESFEAHFGPSNYAFRYGNTHFIILDDIYMHSAPKANPYKGGFSEDQFTFVSNYLKMVEKGQLVILAYHIPLCYKEGQFITQHRERLFNILDGHNVFGLSAHTHIQMQFLLGKEAGWNGDNPFHEYNVGTSNGDWYSGKINENGTPDATMRDGTPEGYAIISISGNKYTCDYKVAGKTSDYQIDVTNPKVIPYRQGGKYPVYANFFLGSSYDNAEFRIDNGEWKKMTRTTEEAAPSFLAILAEWDNADYAMKGKRPNSIPTYCTHLWKGILNNSLEPGKHLIEIRITDMYGRTHTAESSYIIV